MKQRTEIVRCGCGKSCGCGGGEVKAHAESFTRPRFFAGQLLTEEDLGQLDTYVVGKNRLHNRYFFGAGVVCGLEVSCHECDGGKVNLHPGYALDCCGNDIVVPCLEEIDVIAMIRDLRLRERGGHDCGDPCAEGEDGKKDGATRHYCLYVRYAEELLEPVAPYATDQSCDGVCEPTRVREGYSVELRCGPHEHPAKDDVVTRVLGCLGDLGDLAGRVSKVVANQRINTALVRARDIDKAGATYTFGAEQGKRLKDAEQEVANIDFGAEAMTADRSHEVLERLRVLRQYVALARAATDLGSAGLTESDVQSAEATLHQVVEKAPRDEILSQVAEHDRASASAVLRSSTADLGDEEQARLGEQLMRLGLPFDAAAQRDYTAGLRALREWLLVRLEESPVVTACKLRDEVAAVRIVDAADRQQWVTANAAAYQTLTRAFAQYLLDCVCAALNPPCPSCDDQGVLVACVDVVDCEVVDICNRVRTTVITGTALRYWLAPLTLLHRALEKLCCEFELRLDPPPPPSPDEPSDEPGDDKAAVASIDYQYFVAPSQNVASVVREQVGGRAGAELQQVVDNLRLTVAASGTSPLEAVGLAGAVPRLAVPDVVTAGVRTAASSVVTSQVEAVLAGRPVDTGTVAAVRREVIDAINKGEVQVAAPTMSEEAIRDQVVPRVVEVISERDGADRTAADVQELKNSLRSYQGGTTKLRRHVDGRLEQVTAELESTRERLAALEAQLAEGGGRSR